jgi:signal transduction histidine kinase
LAVLASRVREGLLGLRSALLRRSLNVVWLALITAASVPEIHLGDSPRGLANLSLLVVAGVAWLYALVLRVDAMEVGRLAALTAMTLTGGAMVPSAALPLVFPGVALMVLALRWRLITSAALTILGVLATLVANVDEGHVLANVLGMLAVCLAGTTVGSARRQSAEAGRREAAIELERVRADLEHERAELFAQRNHLAREIHDVLAHTLAALSVQLEALSVVIDADASSRARLAEPLDRARRLVRDGIGEVRGAIATLRDDPTPLDERVAKMSAERGAAFSLRGTPRAIEPKASIAIFRAVQEALTNAIKHAPGSPISVELAYGDDSATATIENPLADHDAHHPTQRGGGYGLVGMHERVAELGGSVHAGPKDNMWRVVVSVPAQR